MNNLLLHNKASKTIDRWMARLTGPFVTIYTLHRPSPEDHSFDGIDETLLESCLQFAVENGYDFLSIDELVSAAIHQQELSKPTLCFTLDDGYADQLSRLVPVLLKYHVKPTLFVITDFIDQADWPWDAKISYIVGNTKILHAEFESYGKSVVLDCSTITARANTRRALAQHAKGLNKKNLHHFLTELESICFVVPPKKAPEHYTPASWDDLRNYEKQGLRIGSHTRSHYVLNALTSEEVLQELAYSKARIETEMENPSNIFCYPSGTADDFSAPHPDLVAQSGFSAALTTISKPTNMHIIRNTPYKIDRIGFPRSFNKFVRYSSWVEVLRNKFF